MRILTLDTETEAIDETPTGRAPKPVGLAIKVEGKASKYLAFGHPTGNNATLAEARDMLRRELAQANVVVAFNANFDVGVIEQHFDTPILLPVHDVQVLAFLDNPHARALDLKSLAHEKLSIAPDERDAVREWLVENDIIRKALKKNWGAFISQAPGNIVAPYAKGDTDRTYGLYKFYKSRISSAPFQREVRLAPVLRDMEKRGVPVDVERLEADGMMAHKLVDQRGNEIAKALGARDIDIDKPAQLADAIENKYGPVLPSTPTGKRSLAKESIENAIPDKKLLALLMHRSSILYVLRNILVPWLSAAYSTGGTIHPHWSSTRSDDGGARTGRLASSPNLQNLRGYEAEMLLVKRLTKLWRREWQMLNVRAYVKAPPGWVVVGRDYSQIELRLAAYFEQGILYEGYQRDPKWDLHKWVVDRMLADFGIDIGNGDKDLARLNAKRVGFGILYGAGGPGIARTTGQSIEDAVRFKNTYLNAIPTLRDLIQAVNNRGRNGGFVTTLGEHVVKVQPPAIVYGEVRTFEYKLLNYLIQGSAAELMKEAMIEYYEETKHREDMRMIMSIHDEPATIAKERAAKESMRILKNAMHANNQIANLIDVPILSNGYIGYNFAQTENA